MKKVLCMADSFKGTLSSEEVNRILADTGNRHFPQTEFQCICIADGGEGCVNGFLQAVGGQRLTERVQGPWGGPVDAAFALLPDGKTAVVEMAACAGLPLAGERKNPEQTTTFGVGQLIQAAVSRGAKQVLLGLGGSCTHDGGCGMAAALGVEFLDAQGGRFIPTGETLGRIAQIRMEGSLLRQHGVRVTAMCDVDSPACGEHGAARVFAPQKGADAAMAERLEQGTEHLCAVIARELGRTVRDIPGAGAAGAMGAGVLAFADGQLRSGIDTLLDLLGFEYLLEGADLVITGEGRLDGQSAQGKAVNGIARRAKQSGVPVLVLAGGAGCGAETVYSAGVNAVMTCCREPGPLGTDTARHRADAAFAADNLFRLLRLGQELRF